MFKYFVEFIGTFIFLSVILMSNGNAISIGVALASVILFGGAVSGGHFNPAVSYMSYINNSLDDSDFLVYVIAQILGATLAVYYFNHVEK